MQKVPYLHTWHSLLAEQRGDEQAALIAAHIEQHYAALLDQQSPITHPSQTRRLRQLILPGLALYQTLLDFTATYESCLSETERLFKATLFLNECRFTAKR